MTPSGHEDLIPEYGSGGLAGVMPAVARSLGVSGLPGPGYDLVPARRAVVVLVDGLGAGLLARRSGHAPFLRSLMPSGRILRAGFPSTTATSLASLGTGLPPGAHGLVGYEALDPGTGEVFNELSWQGGPDPESWQPFATVFQRAAATVEVTSIGPARFEGSGLTVAALRGARFSPAERLEERIDAALAALAASRRALVYLYWGEVDMTGHAHGCDSRQWSDELERIDSALARLAAGVPAGTAVHITADHGMVDTSGDTRIDLAGVPELAAGVRVLAGDARAPHVHAVPGAAADVLAAWRAVLGARARVLSRAEAAASGLFGEVSERVLGRLGDVVAAMRGRYVVLDSRAKPHLLGMVGHHGSTSADELEIPLLSVPPR